MAKRSSYLFNKRFYITLISLIIISALAIFAFYYFTTQYKTKQIKKLAAESSFKQYYGDIPVITLSGTYRNMGIQYGTALKLQLKEILAIINEYYIGEQHLTQKDLEQYSNLLYNRFPKELQNFMKGAAIGSGLNIKDIKILNAMETFPYLLNKPTAACAFVAVPQNKTSTGSSLIGRNYDYKPPFNKLAKYLTITILNQPDKIPTAFISIAGEMYCPTCINAKGIFMELNSGIPSGGYVVNHKAQSMLANMLLSLQNSNNISQALTKLNGTRSDFSLIVNIAQNNQLVSMEFSANESLGMRAHFPQKSQEFASTNYFLDNKWGKKIPQPNDEASWLGITRRNHLLTLMKDNAPINNIAFQQLMDLGIVDGGAKAHDTIYQLIFDEKDLSLYVKLHGDKPTLQWQRIPLGDLLNPKPQTNLINKV